MPSFAPLARSCLIVACTLICEANKQAVILHPGVSSGVDGAFIDCPCTQKKNTSLANMGPDAPENYGSSCKAWDVEDNGHPTCQVPSPPAWCSRLWCYVKTQQCRRPFSASVIFEGMHFSYQTCGSLDLYTELSITEPPGGFYNGLMYNGLGRWQPSGIHIQHRVVIKYVRELLYSMGLDPDRINHRSTTNASTMLFPGGSYTALVHDIALGHIHFGMYAFWQTSERINFGVSPIPLWQDGFYFWTPKQGAREKSIWNILWRPLSPFTWDLWCLIIGTVVLAALNLVIVELGIDHVCRNPKSIIHGIYHAFMSLFAGAPVKEYDQPAARVISLGFSIFIVIILASFTGGTTSNLVGRSTPRFSSFENAVAKREPICLWSVTESALVQIHPVLSEIGVSVEWTSAAPHIFNFVQKGLCKHGIASITEHESELSCLFVRVGDPITAIPVGPFVQKALQEMFTFPHAKMREEGIWGSLAAPLNPQHSCPEADDEKPDINNMQLSAEHMLGICILMAVCSTISMLLYLCRLGEKEIVEEIQHSREFDGVATVAESKTRDMPQSSPDSMIAVALEGDGAVASEADQISGPQEEITMLRSESADAQARLHEVRALEAEKRALEAEKQVETLKLRVLEFEKQVETLKLRALEAEKINSFWEGFEGHVGFPNRSKKDVFVKELNM